MSGMPGGFDSNRPVSLQSTHHYFAYRGDGSVLTERLLVVLGHC